MFDYSSRLREMRRRDEIVAVGITYSRALNRIKNQ
jgi:hypothetical protein